MLQRLRIIGVMGSGSESHAELAAPLGRLIAESGCHLLTGGGYGVMAEVSRSFCSVENRKGLCIGIIRSSDLPVLDEKTGSRCPINHHINEWVEIPIFTHLPLSGREGTNFMSRNHINVLSSDLLIALPGGAGTYSEVLLRVQYRRPVLLYMGNGCIDGKKAAYFINDPLFSRYISVASSIEDIRERMEQLLHR